MLNAKLLPGLVLCAAIGFAGWLVQLAEVRLFGRAYVEGLVVAILLGVIVAAIWATPDRFESGIDFAARQLLELAVCLIGVAIDVRLLASGLLLFVGVVGLVA